MKTDYELYPKIYILDLNGQMVDREFKRNMNKEIHMFTAKMGFNTSGYKLESNNPE